MWFECRVWGYTVKKAKRWLGSDRTGPGPPRPPSKWWVPHCLLTMLTPAMGTDPHLTGILIMDSGPQCPGCVSTILVGALWVPWGPAAVGRQSHLQQYFSS